MIGGQATAVTQVREGGGSDKDAGSQGMEVGAHFDSGASGNCCWIGHPRG